MRLNHDYIIHCTTCRSRSELSTDGNGRLVERLNHECTCPLPTFDNVKPNECERCGGPCHPNAKYCAGCAYQLSRERVAEGHRKRQEGQRAARERRTAA